MLLPNNSAPLHDSNVCPECQAWGLTDCQHVRQNRLSKPPAPKADLDPAASAAFLKAALIGALAAISYFAWRSNKARIGESEAQANPQTPFDEWEPNQ